MSYTYTSKSSASAYFEGGTVWQNPENSSYVTRKNTSWDISEVETVSKLNQAGHIEVQVRIKFHNQETVFLNTTSDTPVLTDSL